MYCSYVSVSKPGSYTRTGSNIHLYSVLHSRAVNCDECSIIVYILCFNNNFYQTLAVVLALCLMLLWSKLWLVPT